jgi:hypothetical protein
MNVRKGSAHAHTEPEGGDRDDQSIELQWSWRVKWLSRFNLLYIFAEGTESKGSDSADWIHVMRNVALALKNEQRMASRKFIRIQWINDAIKRSLTSMQASELNQQIVGLVCLNQRQMHSHSSTELIHSTNNRSAAGFVQLYSLSMPLRRLGATDSAFKIQALNLAAILDCFAGSFHIMPPLVCTRCPPSFICS